MTKRRSLILFIFLSLALVVCLLACFVSFTLPNAIKGNYYSYTSFLSNLRFGQDLGNNISLVYRAKLRSSDDNYNVNKDKTVSAITTILNNKGYYDIAVSDYENSDEDMGFKIDIGNTIDKTEIDEIKSILSQDGSIKFYSYFSSDPFAGPEIVKNIYIYNNSGEYYVVILFKDDMIDFIKEKSSGYVAIGIGDSMIMNQYLNINETLENGYMPLSNSEDPTDKAFAVSLGERLMMATLPLDITMIEFNETSSAYGNYTLLAVGIILLVVVLALFICYVIKYGQLGWLACYNFLMFVVLGMFFLQAIPLVHINFAGILAVLLGIGLVAVSTIGQYSRAKELYNKQTKLFVAIKSAERDTMTKTIIIHALAICTSVICLPFGSAVLTSFGWTLLVLSVVSLFVTLASSRLLNRLYLPFNSTDGVKCHFVKGGKNEK